MDGFFHADLIYWMSCAVQDGIQLIQFQWPDYESLFILYKLYQIWPIHVDAV